jgi:uncharacterized protein
MQKSIFSYFSGSLAFTAICLITAFLYGGPSAMFIAAVLGVLEVSLSFDNAVVNATVLKDWNEKWRKIFLTVGMFVAVFLMRGVFPIVIVQVTANMSFFEAAQLAFSSPAEYAAKVTAAHFMIAGFGGAFLMMVFLEFFLNSEKDVHWIHMIEAPLTRIGKLDMVQALFTAAVVYFVSTSIPGKDSDEFFKAGLLGIGVYILVNGVGLFFEQEDNTGANVAATVGKQGIFGFLYLEVLDASFSFDGVIGAFALTNNIIIIALGLGIGAMFVRSMTIFLVEKDTLSEFKYLEHGAFWAIGALALIMLFGVMAHIPEVVTGLIGVAFVGLAVWSSLRHRKAEAAAHVKESS